MKTVYSPLHIAHAPKMEFFRGRTVECFENPERALRILKEINKRKLGDVIVLPPSSQSDDYSQLLIEPALIEPSLELLKLINTVHDRDYVEFVRTIFHDWHREVPMQSYALPHTLNRLGRDNINLDNISLKNPYAKLGYYSFDVCTPITAGTWAAAISSAWCAVRGQEIVREEGMAFALCRPPGHHAHPNMCGGYCFFNNAAIAAEAFHQHDPTALIAILDVDYHHGNGTQAIFYDRKDVLYLSIHGDPANNYPYFLGFSDEIGEGDAEGFNVNFPLPQNTQWPDYCRTLDRSLDLIQSQNPGYLIVSLGVDTFKDDGISQFLLESSDFIELGKRIGLRKWPTLFVMEGGYHDQIGETVVNVLQGFQASFCASV